MVWDYESIHSVWEAPFATMRLKYPRMDAMWDLTSVVHAKTGELDKFAMVAWVIWQCRNKLWCKEQSTSVHKIFKSALTLLAEF